ncbi:alpha/beta fold hydrolase [Salinarimonas ramus]|uniref:Alpha/beta hydrolase n=1 Tax=Salinarimonas ramus TaxID=690164 RepID=A0A917Q591_9HYPH|nr:alpha/beta fold hydrolase [Salinarimonas ramus]GGK22697.1 alpha/beta hydrolase [Salinarimonas ramus]
MAETDPSRIAGAALGALALAAGGAALYSWIHARRVTSEMHPPIGRFVEVDGVRLHYVERGPLDAPPILFVHGNGACLEDLLVSGLVDACATRYRCIVPDRPGYGHSTRPSGRSYTPQDQAVLLSRFLDTIGVERPLVVGHSWGALASLAMALDPRADVAGAVLMSGYYYPQERGDVALMGLPAAPVIGPALRWTLGVQTMRRMAPKLYPRLFHPRPIPERMLRDYPFAYAERPEQMRAASAELAAMSASAEDLAEDYASCAVPVALLHGSQDAAIDGSLHTGRLAAEIEGASVAFLPGLGHMIHYFAHDDIVAAIDSVASRAEGRAPDEGRPRRAAE